MEQITLFSGSNEIRIDKKIRLIELFAGIGSQAKALKNIGADFEHYRICEFDKYAVTSYNAIHGTDLKVSDITKWHAADLGIIEKDKYEYIVTYSFPCQSLSVAGKGAGMAKGSGTRSGLLWEVERILEECDGNLPQVLLMENVDAILFEKNRKHFFQWCNRLEEFGYKNYYEVLNAKDYGIPHNRNRCFMVSILGDSVYNFPEPIKLNLCVMDILEPNDNVPENRYLSVNEIRKLLIKSNNKEQTDKDGIRQIGNLVDTESYGGNPNRGRIYDPEYLCPAINSMNGGQREPKFILKDDLICYNQFKNNGCQTSLNDRIYDSRGSALSITTSLFFMPLYLIKSKEFIEKYTYDGYYIRKLMPIECYRLMGFTREDFFKVKKAGISDCQCYKQAGNSIVVDVLEAIFRNMNLKGVKRWQE